MTRYAFRGDTATITTYCRDEDHTFTVSPTGAITNTYHDQDADKVMLALGAQRDPCTEAYDVFTAAQSVVDAHNGTHDSPALAFSMRRRVWISPTVCEGWCPATIEHYSSPEHIGQHFGCPTNVVTRVLRWWARNGIAVPETAFGRQGSTARTLLITDAYRESAERVVGPNMEQALRSRGVRVEWLTAIADNLDPLTPAQPRYLGGLAAARNRPADHVAEYLNAGITSYFHTYSTHHIPAERVMAHWREHGTPLAETLSG
jgi:hypothetical protein